MAACGSKKVEMKLITSYLLFMFAGINEQSLRPGSSSGIINSAPLSGNGAPLFVVILVAGSRCVGGSRKRMWNYGLC